MEMQWKIGVDEETKEAWVVVRKGGFIHAPGGGDLRGYKTEKRESSKPLGRGFASRTIVDFLIFP